MIHLPTKPAAQVNISYHLYIPRLRYNYNSYLENHTIFHHTNDTYRPLEARLMHRQEMYMYSLWFT